MLGITNKQQWKQHISTAMTQDLWSDPQTVTTKVTTWRLEWLGHAARMPSHRASKIVLYGWLPHTRPPGGHRKDQVHKDLSHLISLKENDMMKQIRSSGDGMPCTLKEYSINHHQQQGNEVQSPVVCAANYVRRLLGEN